MANSKELHTLVLPSDEIKIVKHTHNRYTSTESYKTPEKVIAGIGRVNLMGANDINDTIPDEAAVAVSNGRALLENQDTLVKRGYFSLWLDLTRPTLPQKPIRVALYLPSGIVFEDWFDERDSDIQNQHQLMAGTFWRIRSKSDLYPLYIIPTAQNLQNLKFELDQ